MYSKGYELFKRDRPNKRAGGVALYVKKSLHLYRNA